MANVPNWDAIRAEYITGTLSQRQLVEKYGLSRYAMNKHAREEHWEAMRKEFRAESVAKVMQAAEEERTELARRASELGSRVLQLSERILDRLEKDSVSRASADGLEADLKKTIQAYTMMAKSLGIDAESKANRDRLELERERLAFAKEKETTQAADEMPTIIIQRGDSDAEVRTAVHRQ